MKEERLQKIIAQSGIASRRKAEELIQQGRVQVNGQIITELGYKANSSDEIRVDGNLIQKEEKVYFLLNKPKKTVCTTKDDQGRSTVLDCFPEMPQRIFPVGRLDYDTTGVLILTNDGEFANWLMHPSTHLPKTYEVTIDGLLPPEEIKQLKKGIPLEDGMTLPAEVEILSRQEKKQKTKFLISITEGRNHEIKRMMEYFHHEVTRLERIRIGFLDCGSLRQGQYRRLRMYEVRKLMELAKSK